ncbi:MAG TPA: flagellar export chaperone FliS [Armatimonadota bacterium]|nr:flagellar export chaperone FliS [Armatimonadota bacterium]HQK92689.1 flagellar export chaperone FliS [Armatimonadota bacterium]
MSVPKAYQNYRRTAVETASRGRLILLLYDGLLRFLEQARTELAERKPKEAHFALIKAQNVLSELMASLDLDQGGEIARNLLAIYEFMFMQLVDANFRKSAEPVDEVVDLVRTLREAWDRAVSEETADRNRQALEGPEPPGENGGFSVVS